jgi:hypothetical protein
LISFTTCRHGLRYHHSPARALRIAGLSGFFTLIQSRDGPDRQGALSRFDTMPSSPNLQACWNTVAPSSSVCSLNTMPAVEPASSRASFALRSTSGKGLRSSPRRSTVTRLSIGAGDGHLGAVVAKRLRALKGSAHRLPIFEDQNSGRHLSLFPADLRILSRVTIGGAWGRPGPEMAPPLLRSGPRPRRGRSRWATR